MNLHDPARPQSLSGLPGILPHGFYIIPRLQIEWQGPGEVHIGCLLACEASNNFRWHHLACAIDEVSTYLVDFESDPEAFLRNVFGWTAPETREPTREFESPDLKEVMSKLAPKVLITAADRRI